MSSVPVNRYRIWRRASAFHEGPPTNGGSNTRILLNGRSARPQTTQCWAQFSAAHRKRPDRSCDRKATLRAFLEEASDSSIIVTTFSNTTNSRGLRTSVVERGMVMRKTVEKRIPDTAPYKEWLGIVGTMALAVLI